MGFSVSVIPLEQNTGYVQIPNLDYPTFSEWFNYVKVTFNNVENFSELKSDREDAIYNMGLNMLLLSLCEKGYGVSTQASMLVKGSTDEGRYARTIVIPDRAEGESTADLTKRWITEIEEKINEAIAELGIRLHWTNYTFGEDTELVSPPELFPPS